MVTIRVLILCTPHTLLHIWQEKQRAITVGSVILMSSSHTHIYPDDSNSTANIASWQRENFQLHDVKVCFVYERPRSPNSICFVDVHMPENSFIFFEIEMTGILLWLTWVRIWCFQGSGLGHRCGPGLVSGPGTSMCHGCDLKKVKYNQTFHLNMSRAGHPLGSFTQKHPSIVYLL